MTADRDPERNARICPMFVKCLSRTKWMTRRSHGRARRRWMAPLLAIGAVERDTGLSKDILRMWERRYGFPRPERDCQRRARLPLGPGREAATDQAADGARPPPRQDHFAGYTGARRSGGAPQPFAAGATGDRDASRPGARPSARRVEMAAHPGAHEGRPRPVRSRDHRAAQPRRRRRVGARRRSRCSKSTSTQSRWRPCCAAPSRRSSRAAARRACC